MSLALVFLLYRGIELRDQLSGAITMLSGTDILRALGIYLAAALLLSLTWPLLLGCAGTTRPPLIPLASSHLRAQIAKYLPGGIFHFAYRHASARDWRISHSELVFAAGMESALLLGVAALMMFGISGDPRITQLAPWLPSLIWLMPLAIPACWGAAYLWSKRQARTFTMATLLLPVTAAAMIDAVFFVLCGLSLASIAPQFSEFPLSGWIGWVSLAWISGYVVPGAPGGIGIREAALVLTLRPVLGEAPAMALAIAYRMTTVGADGLAALIGLLLGRSQPPDSLPR